MEYTTVQTRHKKRKKYSFSEIVAKVIIYFVMVSFALICIFPLIYEFLLSFASQRDYLTSKFLVLPRDFNIEAYKMIFFQDRIGQAFLISCFVTLVGTLVSMIFSVLGAYVLARKDFPLRSLFFTLILITMFFGGGLIPFYLTVKSYGMNNTLWALIFPCAINTFNMIILRNFFAQVPQEVLDAAEIDGAGEIRKLVTFVIPLARAGVATVALFYFVERWNDWYWPLIFLGEKDNLYPLALELKNVLSANQSDGYGTGGAVDIDKLFSQGSNAAMIIVSIAPMVAIYPFAKKYFTKGVMMGAVKG